VLCVCAHFISSSDFHISFLRLLLLLVVLAVVPTRKQQKNLSRFFSRFVL
jgi:ABC-type transport system involved in cytochrome c biogenesis permease subunit